jgi:mRNA-decapping enzyme subunit 2
MLYQLDISLTLRSQCLLVKGWKSSSGWGFPKGKINQGEPEHVCAIREVRCLIIGTCPLRFEIFHRQVLEETGYNLAGQINPNDVIEMSIREQKISLYIVPDVPENFEFETRTRKEISVSLSLKLGRCC